MGVQLDSPITDMQADPSGNTTDAGSHPSRTADLLARPGLAVGWNRRELFRVPVALPVEVDVDHDSTLMRTTTLDIGHGGIRVLLPEPTDRDQAVRLSLHLSDDEVISAAATVRHRERGDNGYATGLAFDALTSSDSRALSQAMGKHQRRMGPQVQTDTLVHWTTTSSSRLRPGTAVAMSPGAVAVHTKESLQLGDHLSLSVRAAHNICLGATVVDLYPEEERSWVLLALDVLDRAGENQLRSALQELEDEEYWSERQD